MMSPVVLMLVQVAALADGRADDGRELAGMTVASATQVFEALEDCVVATETGAADQARLTKAGWSVWSERRSNLGSTFPEVISQTFSHQSLPSRIVVIKPVLADGCTVMSNMTTAGPVELQRILDGQGARPIFKKSLLWQDRLIDIETISDATADTSKPMTVRAVVARLPKGMR